MYKRQVAAFAGGCSPFPASALMWGLWLKGWRCRSCLLYTSITSNDAAYFEKQNYNGQLIDRYVGNSSNAIEAWNFFVRLSLEDAAIDLSGTAETTTFSAGRIAFLVTGLAPVSYTHLDVYKRQILAKPAGQAKSRQPGQRRYSGEKRVLFITPAQFRRKRISAGTYQCVHIAQGLF